MDRKTVKIVQGDVFFTTAESIPTGAIMRKITQRGVVVAEGEATGHCHAITQGGAEVWEHDGELFLQVDGDEISVQHEEHKPVTIGRGTYKIGIVREYDPFLEESRKVID